MREEELGFYDALEVNGSAVKIMGDEVLRNIARELVETVRRNTTTDWTVKDSVRTKLRTMIKRILRKHGYPPDKQEKATPRPPSNKPNCSARTGRRKCAKPGASLRS
jgi:type I restriction enzyme R subunit